MKTLNAIFALFAPGTIGNATLFAAIASVAEIEWIRAIATGSAVYSALFLLTRSRQ